MKKILLSTLFLCFWLAASADIVPREDAAAIAQRYLSESSVDFVWDGSDSNVKNASEAGASNAAFYVFNGTDSWVIVAADDIAVPILMHGEGTFNPQDMPENMRSLLKIVEADIQVAREAKSSSPSHIARQWVAARYGTKDVKTETTQKLLETAKWGQGDPFNKDCPYDKTGKGTSLTGCVATAMAIVMRYYEWPEAGKGTIPAYTTTKHSISVPARTLGESYNWSSMPLTNGSGWSTTEQSQVARLMADCGSMVEMDYTTSGSGAYSSDIAPALVEYMSYSPAAKELFRSAYTNDTWFGLLKNELDTNGPVIYGGSDLTGSGGHQFVCDGYNSNQEIHINWGWARENYDNTWYAVNYLDSRNGVYSKYDSAIIGLVPDKGTNPAIPIISYESLSVTSGTISVGTEFTVEASEVSNESGVTYNRNLVFALIGSDRKIKEIISGEISGIRLDPNHYYPSRSKQCKITTTPALGDRIALCFQAEAGVWTPAIPGTGIEIGALDIAMIEIPSIVSNGYKYYPKILSGHKVPETVKGYLDGVEVTEESIKLTTGTHTLKAKLTYNDGTTETIEKTVTVK